MVKGTNNIVSDFSNRVPNQWYFVSLSVDSNDIKLFCDGVMIDTTYEQNNINGNYFHAEIGANGRSDQVHDDLFNGIIDDVRIYNRSLSTQEIQFLYTEDAPSAPHNLTGKTHNRTVELSWFPNPESDLKYYSIYRDITSPAVSYLTTISSIDTNFTDPLLQNGIPYYYRITALDSAGNESYFSDELSVTPTPDLILTITSPNGGEVWNEDLIHNFEWEVSGSDDSDITLVELLISTDNGLNYSLLHSSTNSGRISYYIPRTPTDAGRIKIIAYDQIGYSTEDISDSAFIIKDVQTFVHNTDIIAHTIRNDGWSGRSVINDGNAARNAVYSEIVKKPGKDKYQKFQGGKASKTSIRLSSVSEPSLEFPVGSGNQYLYLNQFLIAAIMANGDTVAATLYGDNFLPLEDITVIDYGTYIETITRYVDKLMLGIEIDERTIAVDSNSFIINSYKIKNTSANTYAKLYTGYYNDIDIYDFSQNLSDYSPSNHLAYMYDVTENWSGYAGIRLLERQETAFRRWPSSIVPDSPADIFNLLSTPGIDETDGDSPDDYRILESYGPFNLEPSDTTEITYVLAVGNGLSALKESVSSARNFLKVLNGDFAPQITISKDRLEFGKTKADSTKELSLVLKNTGVNETLEISNITSTNSVFYPNVNSASISPGNSITLTVYFGPHDYNDYLDSLIIVTNDPEHSELVVELSGTSKFSEVSGIITTDTIWDFAHSPYIIKGDVTIDLNKSLRIDPGVRIEFDGDYSIFILSVLQLSGNADSIIVVTTTQDQPSVGFWDKIHFKDTANRDSCFIRFADIGYGGSSGSYMIYGQGMSLVIENSKIHHSGGYGILASSPTIFHSEVFNNTNGGIAGSGVITIDSIATYNNGSYGINLNSSTMSGDMIISINNGGSGIQAYNSTINVDTIITNNNSGSGIYGELGENMIYANMIVSEGNTSGGIVVNDGALSTNMLNVRNNGGVGVFLQNSSMTANRGTINGNNGDGIYLKFESIKNINLTNVYIVDNTGDGIDIDPTSAYWNTANTTLTLNDVFILGNGRAGIDFVGYRRYNPSIYIQDCQIANNSSYGISISLTDKVVSGYIKNSKIDGNFDGIILDANISDFLIEFTTINSNQEYGIFTNNNPTIQFCDVIGNGIDGIQTGNSSISAHYNNIYGNQSYDLDYYGYSQLDASNNYWGTTNQDSIRVHIYDFYDYSSLGIVLIDPILTEQYDYFPPTGPTWCRVFSDSTRRNELISGNSYHYSDLYLVWDEAIDSSSIMQYNIDVNGDSLTSSDTLYHLSGLNTNVSYDISLSAEDLWGNTNTAQLLFEYNKVEPLTEFYALAEMNSVQLIWHINTDGDIEYYNIYRTTDTTQTGSLFYESYYGGNTDSTYTDFNVRSETTYYYAISCVDSFDYESKISNWLPATPSLISIQWSKVFGGINIEYGNSVQQTNDGGYILLGGTESIGAGFNDMYLIKVDNAGAEEWSHTYGGTGTDYGYSVQQTSDGGYILLGYSESFGAGQYDMYLIKVDNAGAEEWSHTYGGTGADYGYSVQQTSDGGYILMGRTVSFGAGQYDMYLIKVNNAGAEEWSHTYGGTGMDTGYSFQETSDGGYILLGRTASFGEGSYDMYLVKVDKVGTEQWNRTFGGTASENGRSVQQTSDGGYLLLGTTASFGAGSFDIYLIKVMDYLTGYPIIDVVTMDNVDEFSDSLNFQISINNPYGFNIEIDYEYRVSDAPWREATVSGDSSIPGGYLNLNVLWNSYTDLPGLDSDSLKFKVSITDTNQSIISKVVGPFHLDNNRVPSIDIIAPTGEQKGDIEINFTLKDLENDTCNLFCYYAVDGSYDWYKATVFPTSISANNSDSSIVWNSTLDLPDVVGFYPFKITPSDNDIGKADTVMIFIDQVDAPGVALLDSLVGEQSGDIIFNYKITDQNTDLVGLDCKYQILPDTTRYSASISGKITNLDSTEYSGMLVWNSLTDLPSLDLSEVVFTVTPYDNYRGLREVSEIFHLDNNFVPSVQINEFTEIQTDSINITFVLSDAESDMISIHVEFKLPDSTSWNEATVFGAESGFNKNSYNSFISWESYRDIPDYYGIVDMRITPSDLDEGVADTVSIFVDNVITTISLGDYIDEQSDSVNINYDINNSAKIPVNLNVEYSVDSGSSWAIAAIIGDTTDIDSTSYSGTIIWDSFNDLPNFESNTVRLKVTPYENKSGIPIETYDFHLDNNLPPSVNITIADDTSNVFVNIQILAEDPENDDLILDLVYRTSPNVAWQRTSIDDQLKSIYWAVGYDRTFSWNTIDDFGFAFYDSLQLAYEIMDADKGESDTITYFSVHNLIGDYDGNFDVNNDDFAEFSIKWNEHNDQLLYETGPAVGDLPELVPIPDGVFDFEDLMVFAQMWNWSLTNNGILFKNNLAKVIEKNHSVQLVQRIPENLWYSDRRILIDIIPAINLSPSLMLVEGLFTLGDNAKYYQDLRSGACLEEVFEFSPSLIGLNEDSTKVLFALAGLNRSEGDFNYNQPLLTFEMSNEIDENELLILEYQLRDLNGEVIETSSLETRIDNLLPDKFSVHNNFPNPFNAITQIRYEIPRPSRVNLVVYDLLGREVTTLINDRLEPGYHETRWNGRNDFGQIVSSGIYFYVFQTDSYLKSGKMILLK